MKKLRSLKTTVFMLIIALALVLTSCTGTPEATTPETTEPEAETTTPAEPTETEEVEAEDTESETPATVDIEDIYGTVTVPVNPERVVALDNRTFETLADWGVELVAAPKPVMPEGLRYKTDDSVEDVGSHNEPNLEVIASVDPDLVIVGQRFASQYDAIKELVPNAAVINLNIDVSADAETPGDNLINGFKDFTISLGQIFDKNEEAAQLVADLDAAIANATEAYNGEDTIMTIIVSGGDIRFAAPQTGRIWGPLYDVFGWKSSLDINDSSSDHQGDDISIEAIAQSNPDWIFVMDRDAGTGGEDALPAADVIAAAPALANVTAITEGQIIYAPNNAYTNESIQMFTTLFENIAETLAAK